MASESRLQFWKDNVDNAGGNLSRDVKDRFARVLPEFTRKDDFADSVIMNLKITELTVFERPEDGKTQARVVCEITVKKDMANAYDMMHGGCAAYLIDMCSTLALSLLGIVTDGNIESVSQALSTTYHAGAPRGARLRIISETTAAGKRTETARSQIWNVTNRRLIASGVHTKMRPTTLALKL
ncbi:uncharacterized protein LAESUDRAFT_725935 [Laetiporus sulphureus 93-53]|uniref:Thioesterase domain-containing protein n=1 Tax=Laetiporus sulphureus 93-53 TaxID=1314785 RepID=A0A165E8V6_9APHY|nr:uncharacterized protein LAESUDRAFT_725935 [Laetiporus sulphureus 93-53]KZT06488.1 hypothetical protein LAESUDRAFT_725935 [Laetiporus sulphureus 93-53]